MIEKNDKTLGLKRKSSIERSIDELIAEKQTLSEALSAVQSIAQVGIWLYDLKSCEVIWSNGIDQLLELDSTVSFDLSINRSLIQPDDQASYDLALDNTLIDLEHSKVQYKIITPRGSVKHLSMSLSVLTNAIGHADKVMAATQDVTRSVETTNYLVQSKNHYKLLTDTLPMGIYRSSLAGDLLFVNQTMLELFGANLPEEILQRRANTLFTLSDNRELFISDLKAKGELHEYRVELNRLDGTPFFADISCLLRDGEIHGVLQNSSLKTQIEHEKNELIKTLESQNEDLEKFAHIISHNLRSPLANIMGLTQLLDCASLSTNNKEIVEFLKISTRNLDLIINDLNNIVSIRESRNDHYELVNIYHSYDAIIEKFKNELIANGVVISTNIQHNDQLHCIPGFIEGILEGLIDNAIKFIDPNKKLRKVSVAFTKKTNSYSFEISDNGIGFNVIANSDRLFKLYEKFNTKYPGRGTGLYTTYNLVNVLKGKIKIDSTPAKGTIVKIKLPRY